MEKKNSGKRLRIDIEEVEKFLAWKRKLNTTPLENIAFYKNGKRVRYPQSRIKEWNYCGMTNLDFIATEYYKDGDFGTRDLGTPPR